MDRKRALSLSIALAGAATAALTYRAFRRDLDRARKRISSGSEVVHTSCGPIEYASVGVGFPLLVIHGAGGGFDQLRGFDSDNCLSKLGFRLIFVSRFGYLRTPLPADASTRAQAKAHAALLDSLGIQRAAVLAVSAGAPSGLEFAAQYPERCAALALVVPAAYVPGLDATAPEAPPLMQFFRDTLLKYDFAFWLAIKRMRGTMIENILATPLEVANRASLVDRNRMDGALMDILPVSKRRAGLNNELRVVAQLEPANLARITAPTLIVSAEDDLYGTFRSARYLAREISGARLVMYPEGGHLWIGHEQELRQELEDFLRPLAGREESKAPGEAEPP
ncbi:MAG: alpha/beta hydrolase [Acidobacteria bacterium]|nr:alpha/beta hydrolase [Acidobacteriota bacterium]